MGLGGRGRNNKLGTCSATIYFLFWNSHNQRNDFFLKKRYARRCCSPTRKQEAASSMYKKTKIIFEPNLDVGYKNEIGLWKGRVRKWVLLFSF